ncbi:phospholipase D-like domain-containing protein [Candidatus Carsonella ruddii]|uniref:phospholipase D-like domain-containing protein n=1 Tax=Carsonella ruddii TaxID=114186 RepID=UPI003D5B6237
MIFLLIPHFLIFCFLLKKKEKKIINCIGKKKKKNKIKYSFFFYGYVFFRDLFKSIIIAEKNIFAQFYIIRNDFLGKKFLSLMRYKSEKKLVILLVDYIGTNLLNVKLNNIFFSIYNKKKILLNFRNHKKVIFIDNKILWIGGNNVGKEYINLNFYIKYWNDFHCKIKNVYPNFIVENFNFQNIKSNFTIKKIEICKKFFFLKCVNNFVDIVIFFTKKKIIIMSPYVILDMNLINLIKNLIKKNIEIIFLISYKTDNFFIQCSSIIFLKFLMNYKTKVFFLEIGFYHRKIYIIDDKYIFFGSINFDIRSVYINKECLFIINDKKFLKEININIEKNFFFKFINYKKTNFLIKFIYVFSFLNYYLQ